MLHLHRAERADRLADGLAQLLRTPPADPFAREVVAVPARGVERWLVQRLSHVLGAGPGGDGICSGVDFPSTGRLLAAAVHREDDPWDAERLVWPLLDVIDASLGSGEAWSGLLAEHLGAVEVVGAAGAADHRRGRRWATAAHLAGLFASYGSDRPGLLRDWAAGRDTDGADPVPGDLAWQPELWRRLRERLGPSPAERAPEVGARLRDDPAGTDLPPRLSLFGPTRLSTEQLATLGALAARREVHLWLPHPSPALWDRLAERAARTEPGDAGPGVPCGRTRRRADPTRDEPRHPLLASLGRDARELQAVVGAAAAAAGLAVTDEHLPAPGPGSDGVPATLLGRLQADIRDDRLPDGAFAWSDRDRSIGVHACHGPARQVEVLREVLLRFFEDDPTLEPRDVLVMCPDIETCAPLVSAAFGLEDGEHPGHGLRVRLADRALRRTNPLLDVVARLLDLADARVTASQVLDLAATPPVRRRFGFDDDDLERLRGWVGAVGTRWGLDQEHRARSGLDLPQGTWRTGLDRLLLGVAASGDGLHALGLALPLDDVDSSDVDLAGRFAELLDRLEDTLDGLTEQPARDWAAALATGLELLAEVPDSDDWQLAQARWELGRATGDAATPIGLADARAMLADRLRGRPTRANFRTGRLTVATLVPMRSVPHRVVALLGLDDGVFPRVPVVDGDDVLLRDPCVGERDRRSEDRQLLLDAILATGEHLVVVHTGADPLTGERRPPAVPVGELLDVLDATCAPDAEGAPVSCRLVRRHPLQPFDRRDFEGDPFSFDPSALAGARRALGPRRPPPPFLPGPLPAPAHPGDVDLADLVAFLEHPVKAFLRQRLGVGVPGEGDDVEDALPIALDGLQTWDVGERMLTARLAGVDSGRFTDAEWRRGTLPPGPLGRHVLSDVSRKVGDLVAESPRPGPPRTVDVRVDLGGGRTLAGTVTGVHGAAVLRSTYSRLNAKHRLRAWVQLLALAAAGPAPGPAPGDHQPWRAAVTGRGMRVPATSTLTAPADPRAVLLALVALRDAGLREPLPMAAATSAAYAIARHGGENADRAVEAAAKAWTSEFGGDRDDAWNALVWGERADLRVLLGELVTEPGAGAGAAGEPTRFGALARELWDPLLDAES